MRKNDIDFTVKLIKRGQNDGSIKNGNPLALATAFFMSIQGIAEYIARNPSAPAPNPEWIVDIVRG